MLSEEPQEFDASDLEHLRALQKEIGRLASEPAVGPVVPGHTIPVGRGLVIPPHILGADPELCRQTFLSVIDRFGEVMDMTRDEVMTKFFDWVGLEYAFDTSKDHPKFLEDFADGLAEVMSTNEMGSANWISAMQTLCAGFIKNSEARHKPRKLA